MYSLQRGVLSSAIKNCNKNHDKKHIMKEVHTLVNNVFNLDVDDMEIATAAIGLFTSKSKEFVVSASALRKIYGFLVVGLDKIITGRKEQALSDIAQAYIITEYQYRRRVIDKPCLVALIMYLLNRLSISLRGNDVHVKEYARRVRLVLDSALVSAKK